MRIMSLQLTRCRSREGAWIEMCNSFLTLTYDDDIAPVRERGLKFTLTYDDDHIRCRSREGAWIEMIITRDLILSSVVAPVRERGLKCNHAVPRLKNLKSLP